MFQVATVKGISDSELGSIRLNTRSSRRGKETARLEPPPQYCFVSSGKKMGARPEIGRPVERHYTGRGSGEASGIERGEFVRPAVSLSTVEIGPAGRPRKRGPKKLPIVKPRGAPGESGGFSISPTSSGS